jgi:HK97 family phage prohead protease
VKENRPANFCVREAYLRTTRDAAREADFVCSTDAIDSYNEVVMQNWRLERFNQNPVALFGHDKSQLPIGQWKNVRVEGGQLVGTLKLASAAANPLSECVWNSIQEKTLRAVSVGFVPHKVGVESVDGDERVVLDDNELFEISVVPIPANPDAVALMRARAHGNGSPPFQRAAVHAQRDRFGRLADDAGDDLAALINARAAGREEPGDAKAPAPCMDGLGICDGCSALLPVGKVDGLCGNCVAALPVKCSNCGKDVRGKQGETGLCLNCSRSSDDAGGAELAAMANEMSRAMMTDGPQQRRVRDDLLAIIDARAAGFDDSPDEAA